MVKTIFGGKNKHGSFDLCTAFGLKIVFCSINAKNALITAEQYQARTIPPKG